MQTRTIIGVGAVGVVVAAALTQLSVQSQDRQYRRTLQYMHEGREKIQRRMNQMAESGKK